MSKTSNTARTLASLRKSGFLAAVVEKWVPFFGAKNLPPEQARRGGVRQDLFGIIDVLYLDPSRGFVGVQVCSGSTYSQHKEKMKGEKALETTAWLQTPGGHIEIWAWRKVKLVRGGKAMRWKARIVDLGILECVGDAEILFTERGE